MSNFNCYITLNVTKKTVKVFPPLQKSLFRYGEIALQQTMVYITLNTDTKKGLRL